MNSQAMTPASAELSLDEETVTKLVCKMVGCRNPVEQKAAGRPREFCSDACKQKWYRKPTRDERLAQRNERTARLTRHYALDASGFRGCGGPGELNVPKAKSIRVVGGRAF